MAVSLRKIAILPLTMYRATRLAIEFEKAATLATKARYADALIIVDQAEKRYSRDIRLSIEFLIFRGLLLYNLGRLTESIAVMKLSQELLLNAGLRLGDDDRKYLICFVSDIMNRIGKATPQLGLTHLQIDLSSFTFKKVRIGTRKTFPLPQHPEWPDSWRHQR